MDSVVKTFSAAGDQQHTKAVVSLNGTCGSAERMSTVGRENTSVSFPVSADDSLSCLRKSAAIYRLPEMDIDFSVGELDYGENETDVDHVLEEVDEVVIEGTENGYGENDTDVDQVLDEVVIDGTENVQCSEESELAISFADQSCGGENGIDLDHFLDEVREGLANEHTQYSEEIEQAFSFAECGSTSVVSFTEDSGENPADFTPALEVSVDSVGVTSVSVSVRHSPPQSPEILPPYSAAPVRAAKEKMRCFLAYCELPGFPNIRTRYSFLKEHFFPVRHQFLHICHYETEAVLMTRVCHLLTSSFDYNKVIITARRSERVEDIWNALKFNCDLESLIITDDSKKERNIKIFDHFERGTRRILVCPCSTHPPRRCLTGVNLVIYWNGPWCLEHFKWMLERLPSKALILMVLKQDHDWKFLNLVKERFGIVFPELDVDSRDEDTAGYINSRFRKEV